MVLSCAIDAVQKSGDVHVHEPRPCHEARSFRNLDTTTRKVNLARFDANPMSSGLAPKVTDEVPHGRKFSRPSERFHAGALP